jgi:hypothetical protein
MVWRVNMTFINDVLRVVTVELMLRQVVEIEIFMDSLVVRQEGLLGEIMMSCGVENRLSWNQIFQWNRIHIFLVMVNVVMGIRASR